MKLTIQIVNYNSRDYLKTCLLSLRPFLAKERHEIEIIIMNNDADPIGDFLKEIPPLGCELDIVELGRNVGFGKAHNKGFLKASGDCVLFLNPDTEVATDSIDKMLEIFEADQKVGIVGPSLVDSENRIQKDCYGFKKSPLSTIKSKFPKTNIFPKNEEMFAVDWVSGGAMMIRRETFSGLGGFDENYFMYFEDVDLCFRAKKKGWKIIASSSAKVHHRSGKSFSSDKKKKKYYYASQDYYLKKNFGRWQAGLVKLLRLPLYVKNVYFNK